MLVIQFDGLADNSRLCLFGSHLIFSGSCTSPFRVTPLKPNSIKSIIPDIIPDTIFDMTLDMTLLDINREFCTNLTGDFER